VALKKVLELLIDTNAYAAFKRGHPQAVVITPRVTILTIDNNTAEYSANIYKLLKNKGKPIPTNDMWIAAMALQHDFALLTYDKHFTNVDNLLYGQQLKDFLPSITNTANYQ